MDTFSYTLFRCENLKRWPAHVTTLGPDGFGGCKARCRHIAAYNTWHLGLGETIFPPDWQAQLADQLRHDHDSETSRATGTEARATDDGYWHPEFYTTVSNDNWKSCIIIYLISVYFLNRLKPLRPAVMVYMIHQTFAYQNLTYTCLKLSCQLELSQAALRPVFLRRKD